MNPPPLPASFYDRPVITVAQELLGQVLVRETDEGLTTGRIVESEAYLSTGDAACHAARGKTRGNATMFGRAGMAYVYTIHARCCMNVVTEAEGTPCAVLLRAVEPLHRADLMAARRGRTGDRELACGPGRLCEAFDIDRTFDGWDLSLGETLWIGEGEMDPGECVFVSPRIGVTSAFELPLRFCIAANRFVSGTRAQRGL